MKKMMDPVLEAEKIIEAYVGGKTLLRHQKPKKHRLKTILFVTGGGGVFLLAALLYIL